MHLGAVAVPVSNHQIAELLRAYATALAVTRADRFKLKAYRTAAKTVDSLGEPLAEMLARHFDLTELPGIGKGLAAVLNEIVTTGRMGSLERLTRDLPPELVELASRPALNARDVQRAYKKLGISSLRELKEALDTGRIGETFGARMEFQIRRGLDDRPRMLLWDAGPIAQHIERLLRSIAGVLKVAPVGSVRRREHTVGDLNFLFASERAAPAFRAIASALGVKLLPGGTTSERVFTHSTGLQVRLRWTSPVEWGFALLLATGSSVHIREVESHAARQKRKFTRTALKRRAVDLANEDAIYSDMGLLPIPPELREGSGEVAAAAAGKLPQLLRVENIRGDLHMHTVASDGSNTLEEMVAAARERGYEYVAITDHSQSLKLTNGLSEKRLLEQIRAIDRLNGKLKGFRVLKSSEVDILEDGRLDYPNHVLKELDLTICSIHSKFSLPREQQTARLLRAMDNRYFKILGHATGRLLLKRPGYEIDIERVIAHAREVGCFFEINSSPDRLDLSDEHARLAKEAGVKIAINTDAHSIRELSFISAGVNQARRAWLESDDVLNTRSWPELQTLMKR